MRNGSAGNLTAPGRDKSGKTGIFSEEEMTAPARFTQADIERVFRAAKKADVRARIEIEPTGKIVIMSESGGADIAAPRPNPWDEN